MAKGSKKTVEITDEEVKELAKYVADAIKNDYLEVESTYHWKEKKHRVENEDSEEEKYVFYAFEHGKTTGFKNTLKLRFSLAQLWHAIYEKGDDFSLPVACSDPLVSKEPEVIVNREWFVKFVVKNWGNINNYGRAENCVNFYNKYLTTNRKVLTPSNYRDLDKIKDKVTKGNSRGVSSVSSWSKFLAFAMPEQFVIYDSRVAYRLNSIIANIEDKSEFLKCFSFYPINPRENGQRKQDLVKKLAKTLGDSRQGSIYDSYATYLRLVDAVTDMFEAEGLDQTKDRTYIKQKIEMTLFSTGKIEPPIVIQKYREDIKLDPVWLQRDNPENINDLINFIEFVLEEVNKH